MATLLTSIMIIFDVFLHVNKSRGSRIQLAMTTMCRAHSWNCSSAAKLVALTTRSLSQKTEACWLLRSQSSFSAKILINTVSVDRALRMIYRDCVHLNLNHVVFTHHIKCWVFYAHSDDERWQNRISKMYLFCLLPCHSYQWKKRNPPPPPPHKSAIIFERQSASTS